MASSSVIKHNEAVLNSLDIGDMVEFKRSLLHSHWAIYVGNGDVIHFIGTTGDNFGPATLIGAQYTHAIVERGNFSVVAHQSVAQKHNRLDGKMTPKTAEEIVLVATSMVGLHIGYNFIWRNCEHFANLCRYGLENSEQSDRLIRSVGGGAAVAIAVMAYMLWPTTK